MGISCDGRLESWKRYKERNREKLNALQRDYYQRNRDAILARKRTANQESLDKTRESQLRSAKKRYAEIKSLIFEKYGNRCRACDFGDMRALQIDHVNGGGTKDVMAFRSNWSYLRHVLEDETGKFQLLCANCNQIKRFENAEHRGKETYKRRQPIAAGG